MASMTQADDTPHNTRARQLYSIFSDERQPETARSAARDELFYKFEALAYSYAKTILPRWGGDDAEDIRQTAAVALCLARDMWEPERGPFAVILMFAIKNELRNWLRRQDMIVRSHRTFHLNAQQRRDGVDASGTDRIRVISLDNVHFNNGIDDDGLRIELADPDAAFTEVTDTQVAVRQIVSRLPAKERDIVTNYYGLNGDEPKTLRETATEVGRSHETVRQSLSRAHQTIRASLHGYA